MTRLLCFLGLHKWIKFSCLKYCTAPIHHTCSGKDCGLCEFASNTICERCGRVKK